MDAAVTADSNTVLNSIRDRVGRSVPTGWRLTTLGECFTWSSGGTPRRTDPSYFGGDIPWAVIGDLNDGVITDTQSSITDAGLRNSSAKWVEPGSVLVAMYGSIGKLAIAGRRLTTNQAIAFTKPDPVDPKYLYYYLLWQRPSLARLGKGATQLNISQTVIKQFPFLLAPPDEQRRIVAEIEKQFSRLDEAVANLKRVKASLKRYKASVLKAAVEGRLVPTEAELARREERAFDTAAEHLTRLHGAGKDGRQGRLGGATRADQVTSELPVLPPGWCWSDFEAVADRVTVGHVGPMKDEYVAEGIPFLRSQNVRPNRYDPEGLKFISPDFHSKLQKSALEPGDIVVVRSGSVGVACVIPESLPVANCSDLVIVKRPRGVLANFGAVYLNAVVDSRIAAGRVGVALAHFNTKSVAKLPVPVPPMAEQVRIVLEVERRMSVAAAVEVEVDLNLERARSARHALLKAMFIGQASEAQE